MSEIGAYGGDTREREGKGARDRAPQLIEKKNRSGRARTSIMCVENSPALLKLGSTHIMLSLLGTDALHSGGTEKEHSEGTEKDGGPGSPGLGA